MRSPVMVALLNPFNLAILFLSVMAGLIAAWWLFPLGLLLWIIMVAVIANDKSIRINYNMEARLGTLSMRFQKPYANVVRSQTRIFNALLSTSGRTRRAMSQVQDAIGALVDHVYAVCQQMTAPENYLKTVQNNSDLEGQRALIVLSLNSAEDPVVKKEKEDEVHALEGRIQEIKDIGAMLDRVEAQLSSLVVSMDAMLAEIMRLQMGGPGQIEKESPNLLQQIHQETEQLEALEHEASQHKAIQA
jgi:hypothetical protein